MDDLDQSGSVEVDIATIATRLNRSICPLRRLVTVLAQALRLAGAGTWSNCAVRQDVSD
jgi:hypothetical protein